MFDKVLNEFVCCEIHFFIENSTTPDPNVLVKTIEVTSTPKTPRKELPILQKPKCKFLKIVSNQFKDLDFSYKKKKVSPF